MSPASGNRLRAALVVYYSEMPAPSSRNKFSQEVYIIPLCLGLGYEMRCGNFHFYSLSCPRQNLKKNHLLSGKIVGKQRNFLRITNCNNPKSTGIRNEEPLLISGIE